MRVTYHIGLHSTDEDRLLRCLLQNSDALAQLGTAVSPPNRFRPVLRDAMLEFKGRPATERRQSDILQAVCDMDAPERLVFSNDSFLCVPRRAILGDSLYPLAGERIPWMRNLFPDHPAEFAFALRNPATLVPALHARFASEESFSEYLCRIDPEALSWVDLVVRIRAVARDCPLTIWCNEDSPLIWPEILEALSGTEDGTALEGAYEFLNGLMTDDGSIELQRYSEKDEIQDPQHRRNVFSAFLTQFAREEAVAEIYELPGWTSDRIARLSGRYESDVEQISAMDGVTFLAP